MAISAKAQILISEVCDRLVKEHGHTPASLSGRIIRDAIASSSSADFVKSPQTAIEGLKIWRNLQHQTVEPLLTALLNDKAISDALKDAVLVHDQRRDHSLQRKPT